jgi:hypothetical protein
MRRIGLALIACALLSLASCSHSPVLPDPTIPHRVAAEAQVYVWARQPDGALVKTKVRLLPGWWVAGPPVVEPMP